MREIRKECKFCLKFMKEEECSKDLGIDEYNINMDFKEMGHGLNYLPQDRNQ
jgi:hypothetical protein